MACIKEITVAICIFEIGERFFYNPMYNPVRECTYCGRQGYINGKFRPMSYEKKDDTIVYIYECWKCRNDGK